MQMRKLPQQNQRSKRYVYVATFLVIMHAHKTPQSYKSLYSKQEVFIVQRFKNNIYMQSVHVDTDARVMYASLIGVSLT